MHQSASPNVFQRKLNEIALLLVPLKGPIHDSDFNRNRDVQPDRGCGCC